MHLRNAINQHSSAGQAGVLCSNHAPWCAQQDRYRSKREAHPLGTQQLNMGARHVAPPRVARSTMAIHGRTTSSSARCHAASSMDGWHTLPCRGVHLLHLLPRMDSGVAVPGTQAVQPDADSSHYCVLTAIQQRRRRPLLQCATGLQQTTHVWGFTLSSAISTAHAC